MKHAGLWLPSQHVMIRILLEHTSRCRASCQSSDSVAAQSPLAMSSARTLDKPSGRCVHQHEVVPS